MNNHKDLSRDWQGHPEETSAVLLEVLTTAVTASEKLSESDRVLFTACEFWAAARHRNLIDLLKDDPEVHLRAAEAAFLVIGLGDAANIVRCGRIALTRFQPPASLAEVASNIETVLAELEEPVDAMIALFSSEHAASRNRARA